MRNPKWHRDEVILALELYFRLVAGQIHARNPKIIELSELLNKLPIYEIIPDSETFRNANGVSLKLSNFLAIDPKYHGKGMQSYSKLDEQVFNEFVNRKGDLKHIAQQIKRAVLNSKLNLQLYKIENEEDEDMSSPAKEGAVLYKLHKHKERNQSIVKEKKKSFLKTQKKLNCEICGFDFHEVFGDLGKGFIECHHIKALSELDGETLTLLEDLILVCPNCHRMLHRKFGTTIEELREIIKNR